MIGLVGGLLLVFWVWVVCFTAVRWLFVVCLDLLVVCFFDCWLCSIDLVYGCLTLLLLRVCSRWYLCAGDCFCGYLVLCLLRETVVLFVYGVTSVLWLLLDLSTWSV